MRRYLAMIIAVLIVACMATGCGENYLESGTERLEAEDYEAAVDQFKEAVEADQNPGDAYRGIGIAEWELGQYEAARNAFESALEHDAEKTATLYNFLASCEMRLGEYKSALNYLNLGLACEDGGEELMQEMRFNEIVCYEQCGEWENARTKLEEYTADYPDDERAVKEAEFLETQ